MENILQSQKETKIFVGENSNELNKPQSQKQTGKIALAWKIKKEGPTWLMGESKEDMDKEHKLKLINLISQLWKEEFVQKKLWEKQRNLNWGVW